MIRVAILGSTGSIGRSTLEVIRRHPDRYTVTALVANRSVDILAAQVGEFRPKTAVVSDTLLDLPMANGETTWKRGIESILEVPITTAFTTPPPDVASVLVLASSS